LRALPAPLSTLPLFERVPDVAPATALTRQEARARQLLMRATSANTHSIVTGEDFHTLSSLDLAAINEYRGEILRGRRDAEEAAAASVAGGVRTDAEEAAAAAADAAVEELKKKKGVQEEEDGQGRA
jgi:hypothetical protein